MTDIQSAETVYVFVRTDLPPADQIVQVGHVCLEAGTQFPLPPACRLVVLALPDQQALIAAQDYCRERGIRCLTFVEPDPVDAGSSEPMSLTALCTEPLNALKRRHLRRFPLWNQSCPV